MELEICYNEAYIHICQRKGNLFYVSGTLERTVDTFRVYNLFASVHEGRILTLLLIWNDKPILF